VKQNFEKRPQAAGYIIQAETRRFVRLWRENTGKKDLQPIDKNRKIEHVIML
jgi:hypothetical protein